MGVGVGILQTGALNSEGSIMSIASTMSITAVPIPGIALATCKSRLTYAHVRRAPRRGAKASVSCVGVMSGVMSGVIHRGSCEYEGFVFVHRPVAVDVWLWTSGATNL